MSHRSCLSAAGAAIAAAFLGCSSGGYIGEAPEDQARGIRDAAIGDAHIQRDGNAPPDDASVDASAMADMAFLPDTWTSFGQHFTGGTGICQDIDSGGKTYFLTTTVADTPYHCQLAVDFPSRPTVDAVYKVSSMTPPGQSPGNAYVLILDYRTGSYEAWNSLDSGEVAVKVAGSSISIEVRSALLHNGMAGIPDETVSGLLVCP